MSRPVYLAGAVAEIERADRWLKALRARGIRVTSTWVDSVRKEGVSNPADNRLRYKYARKDVQEIEDAWRDNGLLWMLAPLEPNVSHGAYFELGYATARGMARIVSGEYLRSIFTSLATFHTHSDELAFQRVARFCEAA